MSKLFNFCFGRFFLLFFFTVFLSGCHSATSWEEARALFAEGKHQEAEKAFRGFLEAHPNSPLAAEAFFYLGRSLAAQGRFSEALEAYEKTIASGSSDWMQPALLACAELYAEQLKNPRKAAEYYERALTQAQQAQAFREAARVLIQVKLDEVKKYLSAGKVSEAQALLAQVLQTYPMALADPDLKAQVDRFRDQSDRAVALRKAEMDHLYIRQDIPFNTSMEVFFPKTEAVLDPSVYAVSASGRRLVKRARTEDGAVHLYWAERLPNQEAVTFQWIPQTQGADLAAWSPDEKAVAYRLKKGKWYTLEVYDVYAKKRARLYETTRPTLGRHPAWHPSGEFLAFTYEGKVGLVKKDGTQKVLFNVNHYLSPDVELTWSADGTMLFYRKTGGEKKKALEGLLVFDILGKTQVVRR